MKRKKVKLNLIEKIVIGILIVSTINLIVNRIITTRALTSLEETLIVDHLETDINYITDLVSDYAMATGGDENQKWSVNAEEELFYGGVYIAGGAVGSAGGDANMTLSSIFRQHEKSTGTNAFVLIRTSDEKLGEGEGHYIRAIGSTKGANGQSIVGTYISRSVADVLDSGSAYYGAADVKGKPMYCIYKPIYDARETVIGSIVVGRAMSELEAQIAHTRKSAFILNLVVLLVCGFGLVIYMYFWTQEIYKIKEYLKEIGTGHFPEEPLLINSGDELEYVADSINEMTESLKENERIGAELSLATSIQANMLPNIFPPFPDHDEFDIFASMKPAKEVGGDFYDFFMIDDSHIAIVIADVSGKGVPAALFMVTAKTLIKDHAQLGLSPAEVFTRVNKILCTGNEAGLFVTGWMGVVDLASGTLTYVNAGHNPPLLYSVESGYTYLRAKPGFVLAGLDTMKYKQASLQMNVGDRIFLYTDGVTEATDLANKLYGEDRLCLYLNQHLNNSIEEVVKGVKGDIDEFVGEAEQFDDITMLLLEYKERMGGNMVERVFPANDSSFNDAMAFIQGEMEKVEVPVKASMQIEVAFEELYVNVAHYAYQGRQGNVTVSALAEENSFTFCLKDTGIPFDPLSKEDPDITISAEDRDIGGLGILMVKKTMDEVKYQYKDGMNIVTVKKNF